MKAKKNNFNFFSYIRKRIQVSTDRLIQLVGEDTSKDVNQRQDARPADLHSHSVYPDKKYNIEHRINKL